MENPRRTLLFTAILCIACATILAGLASVLKKPQEESIRLDRYREMLKAVQLLSDEGYFLIEGEKALLEENGLRVDPQAERASPHEIAKLYEQLVQPKLTNSAGEVASFEERSIDYDRYIQSNSKLGFSKLPWKLFYEVSSPKDPKQALGFIIPVQGFGLWGPIYGLIALKDDGNTVLGISWYEHIETPGLGANISSSAWKDQFRGKQIFQVDAKGQVDLEKSPLGIVVLRGKVQDVYSEDPRANHSVDGMSGATITGDGVTAAYKEVLSSYRELLIEAMQKQRKAGDGP